MKSVHVIINPASGKPAPVLYTLHEVFTRLDVKWDVSLTQKDQKEITAKAMASGADVIAVCGGDGTVSLAAHELAGKNKVMGILPAGTANVLAAELEVPGNLKEAAELLCKGGSPRAVDIGEVNGRHFILRTGFGFEAEFVSKVDAASKSYLGRLAYAFSGLRALIDTKPTRYEMVIDGQKKSAEGFSLIIANSGNLGLPGFKLLPDMSVSDGKLDVFLIRSADLNQIFSAGEGEKKGEGGGLFEHWQAEKISVHAEPTQTAHLDGDPFHVENMEISIHPAAVQILVPSGKK